MFLLVGLGNPGEKYARNRHNAGFMAIDAIGEAHGFPTYRSKFQGLVADGKIGPHRALLLKPQTFYNESGNSIAAAARFYKIDPASILVFHDEIDLAPGKVRVKLGGGLAGNNGLRSASAHLGPDFWRIRIGVGHPGRKDAVMPHVLGDFSRADRADWADALFEGFGKAAPSLLPPDDVAAGRFMSALVQPSTKKAPAAPPQKSKKPQPATGRPAQSASSPFADALKPLSDKDRT